MRPEIINAVFSRLSEYQLKPRKGYDYANARHHLIFESLTQGVQYVFNNAVEGDIAEFGTAFGFTGLTIARAMGFYRTHYAAYLQQHAVPPKNFYLFDSFQGLPEPNNPIDIASPNVSSGRWKEGTFQLLDKEELFTVCSSAYDGDKIKIIDGWFAESLQRIPSATKFAMIHVDCDIYSSSIEVLDYIFTANHVSDGCCIFFDDWSCNRSSPRFGQRRAWRETVEKHKIEFSDCGDYGVLGHKFIVHKD